MKFSQYLTNLQFQRLDAIQGRHYDKQQYVIENTVPYLPLEKQTVENVSQKRNVPSEFLRHVVKHRRGKSHGLIIKIESRTVHADRTNKKGKYANKREFYPQSAFAGKRKSVDDQPRKQGKQSRGKPHPRHIHIRGVHQKTDKVPQYTGGKSKKRSDNDTRQQRDKHRQRELIIQEFELEKVRSDRKRGHNGDIRDLVAGVLVFKRFGQEQVPPKMLSSFVLHKEKPPFQEVRNAFWKERIFFTYFIGERIPAHSIL